MSKWQTIPRGQLICWKKKLFATAEEARQAVIKQKENHGRRQREYQCSYCQMFHLTTVGEKKTDDSPKGKALAFFMGK